MPLQIGPARPIVDSSGNDSSVQQLVERFARLLSGFDSHPWTLQRLCEVVLEPQKQYRRLHKLVRVRQRAHGARLLMFLAC